MARRQREIADLGTDLDDLGRRLAERWGCDPLVIDAAWLHGEHGRRSPGCGRRAQPAGVHPRGVPLGRANPLVTRRIVRRPKGCPDEPRLRILVAEVQARTASAFVAADATLHEERMTRQNARLRLLLATVAARAGAAAIASCRPIADSDPAQSPEEWAARAALSWCAEPGVSAARVVWVDRAHSPRRSEREDSADPAPDDQSDRRRCPRIRDPPRSCSHLRSTDGPGLMSSSGAIEERSAGMPGSPVPRRTWPGNRGRPSSPIARSWSARVQTIVASFRQRSIPKKSGCGRRKLDALGEFAGGAGHELNNPLAVIVGPRPAPAGPHRRSRNDAIAAHHPQPGGARSSHPSRPHVRGTTARCRGRGRCRPAELLRSLPARFSRRSAPHGEFGSRSEIDESAPAAWFDPDGLRHLAEILLRNAIQATPARRQDPVRSSVQGDELCLVFQ